MTLGRGPRLSVGAAVRFRRLVVGALLLLGLLLPPVAAHENLTTVAQIAVVGTTLLDTDAVIQAANIAIGESLLSANLRAAEKAVSALPLVASVRVSAGLPDRIQIRVREKSLLLRWQIDGRIHAVTKSGELLGEISTLDLSENGLESLAAAPLLLDDRPLGARIGAGQLTTTEFDVATRLASLTPQDFGSEATALTLRIQADFGFVVQAAGPSIAWNAVFGIYSATIRPTSMIPGQVRLLRSVLAGRESQVGWIILADDQAGTYTEKGVRPPPPFTAPSPSPNAADPSSSPSASTVIP